MTSNRDDLDSIEPSTARDLFLEHKATECTNSTVRNYRYALKSFVTWCEKEGTDNLNALTGRHLHQFRVWRKNDGLDRWADAVDYGRDVDTRRPAAVSVTFLVRSGCREDVPDGLLKIS